MKSRMHQGTAPGTPFETWSITASAARELRATVGTFEAEENVMFGGDREARRITHIYFDHSCDRTGASCSPDSAALNSVLRNDWRRRDIALIGFGHSHPTGMPSMSEGDKTYARGIMAAMKGIDSLLLPIFQSTGSGSRYSFRAWVVRRMADGVAFSEARLEVEPDPVLDAVPTSFRSATAGSSGAPSVSRDDIFTRVTSAYDLERLRRCRLVVVGDGGAAGFVEDMARCGVGEIVLIDPDTVSASNIATQMTYVSDIGRCKVDVLAERLRLINPEIQVEPLHYELDALYDPGMKEFAFGALRDGGEPPIVTLLCGFTDSFQAQARVNRIALNFGLPSLCAQVYAEGRGAELTFTHPDTTPACHRCVLRSRFEAFVEEGFVNTVGSAAAPIFTTTRLNSAKGPLALALLHHGTDHPRWGNMLERIGNRNLVQLRLDPDLAMPVFGKVLGKNKRRVLFDEAVWLPQEPERLRLGHRACPDCAGTGKLSLARGTFKDTRIMRN